MGETFYDKSLPERLKLAADALRYQNPEVIISVSKELSNILRKTKEESEWV